jgi:hypothetical protein
MRINPSVSVSRARVLNGAASELRPFRGAPAPVRSNALPHFGTWIPDEPAAELSPASRARLARILRPAATPATLAQGFQPCPTSAFREVKIRKPLGTFKIPKKGPRAGQQVEECAMIRIGIWEIHCTCGTSYRFTSRSKTVAVTRDGAEVCRLSPPACRETFRRIFEPATAETAICHLFQAGD